MEAQPQPVTWKYQNSKHTAREPLVWAKGLPREQALAAIRMYMRERPGIKVKVVCANELHMLSLWNNLTWAEKTACNFTWSGRYHIRRWRGWQRIVRKA